MDDASTDDLRERLTPLQWDVTQNAGTERAFTGEYWDTKDPGTYRCIVCDEPLFSSDTKYDSGSGWPSFWEAIDPSKVTLHEDRSLFMRRVEANGTWSLFDPKRVPTLPDLWGEDFERAYEAAEAAGLAAKTVKARDLYARMMRTLAQTGNGWMTFKDQSNRTSNQTARAENVIHLSNLCTEILEVTNDGETAVCNLGSINLAAHCTPDGVDFARLAETVRTAVTVLDRTIDLSYYPTGEAAGANVKWRPIGLGVMGLADVFFSLGLDFAAYERLAAQIRSYGVDRTRD